MDWQYVSRPIMMRCLSRLSVSLHPTPSHGLISTSSVQSQPWTHNMRVLNYFTEKVTKDNTNDGKLIRLKRKLGMLNV